MALTTSGWQNELTEILKEVFVDEYTQIESKISTVANMETTDKYQESYLTTSGIGNFQSGVGPVYRLNAAEVAKTTIIPQRWTGAIDIQYELWKTQQHNTIRQLTGSLAMAGKRTREQDFWGFFNHAFDTTYAMAYDSLAPCSTAHTSPMTAATQSNSGTAALSYSSYVAARTAMRKFTDWNGLKIHVVPDTILVPIDLEEQALIIAHSALRPATANNDKSPINQAGSEWRLKVVCCEYLDDTNNWFLLDSRYAKKHMHFLTGESLRTFTDTREELVLTFGGYMRYAFAASDWRFLYGSNVA